MRNFLLVVLYCMAWINLSYAQTAGGKQINIKHAGSLKGDKKRGYQRLIGDVQFEHQGALMFCDSAYFFPDANAMDAFGRVHIQQGDSVHLWGDFLHYDGKNSKAEVQKNVRMTDGDMTLTTDAISYDIKGKYASYSNSGKIINKSNVLTSVIGGYSSESKTLTFKKNVKLDNPSYVMTCDTLRYQPLSKVAYFLGPTTIKSKNSDNFIYCENGFYDTNKDICQFNENAYIITNGQTLKGDSIWYDQKNGFGKMMQNVSIIDTAQRVVIKGDMATYNEKKEISQVIGKALFIQAFENDSLYLHADTLQSQTVAVKDDSTGKIIKAFHHVVFFKSDMQGRCDSLAWTTQDSVMKMLGNPVLWSDGNQLTADTILIHTYNGALKRLDMINNSFIASVEDSAHFNQIKGKKMTGYFKDNELHKIYVEGNAQTLYYAKDKGVMIGVNRADCVRVMIYLEISAVSSISFYSQPNAVLYPPGELPPKESLLKDFKWRGNEQPNSVQSLFLR